MKHQMSAAYPSYFEVKISFLRNATTECIMYLDSTGYSESEKKKLRQYLGDAYESFNKLCFLLDDFNK